VRRGAGVAEMSGEISFKNTMKKMRVAFHLGSGVILRDRCRLGVAILRTTGAQIKGALVAVIDSAPEGCLAMATDVASLVDGGENTERMRMSLDGYRGDGLCWGNSSLLIMNRDFGNPNSGFRLDRLGHGLQRAGGAMTTSRRRFDSGRNGDRLDGWSGLRGLVLVLLGLLAAAAIVGCSDKHQEADCSERSKRPLDLG